MAYLNHALVRLTADGRFAGEDPCWRLRFVGGMRSAFRAVFGGDVLNSPFRSEAPRAMVIEAIADRQSPHGIRCAEWIKIEEAR